VSDVFEGFGSILPTYVEEDFLTATETRISATAAAPSPVLVATGRLYVRMLIYERRGIVDFVVDHEVAIAPLTSIQRSKGRLAYRS